MRTRCASTEHGTPRDRAQVDLSLDRLAPARYVAVPCLRRGGLPDRIAAGARTVRRAARVSVRPGARHRRGPGAAALARPRRPEAATLARARGGRVLRHVLLRLGHPLLSGPHADGPRRPRADPA